MLGRVGSLRFPYELTLNGEALKTEIAGEDSANPSYTSHGNLDKFCVILHVLYVYFFTPLLFICLIFFFYTWSSLL